MHSESTSLLQPDAVAVSSSTHQGPELGFYGLDTLWLQVTGTLCNLACTHCFISCGPKNESHPIMQTNQVRDTIIEAGRYGVKEFYFTGGEPFLHPDILGISEFALRYAPLTILTNAVLITDQVAQKLAGIAAHSEYSFDLRVSIDGATPEENDPIRGKGTFQQILAGAKALQVAGINPVFTVTTVHAQYYATAGKVGFYDRLHKLGFARPRVKFIPPFSIGREKKRSKYQARNNNTVPAPEMLLHKGDLLPGEHHVLQCSSCRAVTSKGVFPCPILIEEAGSKMADTLSDAFRPIELNHPACYTCHVEGFSCTT